MFDPKPITNKEKKPIYRPKWLFSLVSCKNGRQFFSIFLKANGYRNEFE